jgi:hypothetical protein
MPPFDPQFRKNILQCNNQSFREFIKERRTAVSWLQFKLILMNRYIQGVSEIRVLILTSGRTRQFIYFNYRYIQVSQN